MKVLVVDDHAGMRSVTCQMLRQLCGYKTVEAPNGELALRMVPDERPDVAVVDMRLPGGMDGLQVADRLRKMQPDMPIIICTADPETVLSRRPVNLTICDKSEMPDSLVEAIAAVVPV